MKAHSTEHSNVPPLADAIEADLADLDEATAELELRVKDLVDAAAPVKEIRDEEHCKSVVLLTRQMSLLRDEIDAMRKARKAPYLAAERMVDGHFRKIVPPLIEPDTRLRKLLDAFNASRPQPPKVIRTDLGPKMTIVPQTKWELEANYQTRLPPGYWTPDTVKIDAAVKAGIDVPGVRVWKVNNIRIS